MNRKIFFFFFFFLISVFASTASAASISVTGYAWSDTIGWIQFNPTYGGVTLDDATGDLNGYAWSDNIGWVSFDATDATHPSAKINNITTCGSSCVVSGWAKAIGADNNGWDGWISMSGATPAYSVNLDKITGNFSGYAWGSDVVGWISFSGAGYGVTIIPVIPVPTLSVSLSASPSSGAPPLTSILTATVSGTAVGTINYKFDCTNDGTYEGIFNNVSDNPETYSCVYNTAGTYTARVYVERDIAPSAENTATITVTAPICNNNGVCGPGETFANCPNDCHCPNGICDYGETPATCPADCPLSPDFLLFANPNPILATVIKGQGSPTISTSTITVLPQNGFNGNVSLSVSSINPSFPAGVNHTLSPAILNSSSYSTGSTLTIRSGGNLSAGSTGLYTITITGTGGSITHNLEIKFNLEVFDINYCEPPWCP